MSDRTPFTESNALLAIIRDETAEAEAIVRTMLPGELRTLESACCHLADLCDEVRREKMRDG